MLRDITVGQYLPLESKMHAMDPRFKIIASIIFIASLFMVQTIVGYG